MFIEIDNILMAIDKIVHICSLGKAGIEIRLVDGAEWRFDHISMDQLKPYLTWRSIDD